MRATISFIDHSKFPPNYWKWLAIALLILLAIVIYLWLIIPDLEAKEGDFWRDQNLEDWGRVVIEQDFSHIIYEDPYDGQKWTTCHSCLRWFPLEEAHKIIIDRREMTRKRLEIELRENNKKWWQKIFGKKEELPLIITNPEGSILDYEELYYCNDCFCGFADCK